MPPIFGLLHRLSEQYIYLKHRFFSYNFGRPTQDREDDDGFKPEFGSHTGTLNVLDEPHFSFRSTPPLTSPIDDSEPPQSCKRKALHVGVGYNNERSLMKSPHKDVLDMRQFLIGEFKFKFSKKYFEHLSTISLADRQHYNPDDITLLINTDNPDAVHPTRKNIVLFAFYCNVANDNWVTNYTLIPGETLCRTDCWSL